MLHGALPGGLGAGDGRRRSVNLFGAVEAIAGFGRRRPPCPVTDGGLAPRSRARRSSPRQRRQHQCRGRAPGRGGCAGPHGRGHRPSKAPAGAAAAALGRWRPAISFAPHLLPTDGAAPSRPLGFVAALVVRRDGRRHRPAVTFALKWPNDVLVAGKARRHPASELAGAAEVGVVPASGSMCGRGAGLPARAALLPAPARGGPVVYACWPSSRRRCPRRRGDRRRGGFCPPPRRLAFATREGRSAIRGDVAAGRAPK